MAIKIFLRLQQNTCSSNIEIISFFSAEHAKIETKFINEIAGANHKIIIDHEIEQIDLASLNSDEHECCLLLSKSDWINIVLNSQLQANIYILKHEGDFNINGIPVPCDCNHCLPKAFSEFVASYQFIKPCFTHYATGNQYIGLEYSLNPSLGSKEQLTSSKIIGCKLYPAILNKTIPNKLLIPQPSNQEIHSNAYQIYQKLGNPKYFCAPMIGQTELAFRMFLREQAGVHICYTPMIMSNLFLDNPEYRNELFSTCEVDRPLVVQFAANEPTTLLKAAKKVEGYCDAVDINFGCPQAIGRRNNYGSWLMEDWATIYKLISTLKQNLDIPVFCKIRIFEDPQNTIAYAKMIESAGCSLLTVHGRLRKNNMNETPANLEQIKLVKEALNIPVIANGGISSLEEANACLSFTSCDGVMAASNLLKNPYLFSGNTMDPKETALLYLQYASNYQALFSYARPHVMQILQDYLNQDTKNKIAKCNSIAFSAPSRSLDPLQIDH